jgi:hypothetical protein
MMLSSSGDGRRRRAGVPRPASFVVMGVVPVRYAARSAATMTISVMRQSPGRRRPALMPAMPSW